MKRARLQSLALAALLAACGGSDSTGPGGDGAPFTANIDGVAWQADAITLTVSSGGAATPGSLVITGSQVASASNYRSLILVLGFITGPGTYPLGVNQGTTGGGTATVVVFNGTSTSYSTPLSGSAGTVQITSLGSKIAGTFSFVAPPTLGGGSSQTVTNGSFDVSLPSNFVAATTAGRGSTMSASLNGTPWNAATVVGIGTPSSFGLGGTTDGFGMNLTPLTAVAVGTYTVPTQVQILVTQTGTANAWGGAASTGSVTFTAIGTRVTGTFTGSLAATSGGGASLTLASGAFDVKLP